MNQKNNYGKGKKKFKKNRLVAKQDLESDLKSLPKSIEFNSPTKAFQRFVDGVNSTVQEIFLGQFQLTQEKHREAQAKLVALENGSSSKDAMDKYQNTAAISRKKIIDHNEKLNIKHGKANKNIQSKFDKEGKLPRED